MRLLITHSRTLSPTKRCNSFSCLFLVLFCSVLKGFWGGSSCQMMGGPYPAIQWMWWHHHVLCPFSFQRMRAWDLHFGDQQSVQQRHHVLHALLSCCMKCETFTSWDSSQCSIGIIIMHSPWCPMMCPTFILWFPGSAQRWHHPLIHATPRGGSSLDI